MVGLDRETLNGSGCLGQRRCEKTRLENCWSGALKQPEVGEEAGFFLRCCSSGNMGQRWRERERKGG